MFVEGANEGHLVNLIFLLARYSNAKARGAKRFPLYLLRLTLTTSDLYIFYKALRTPRTMPEAAH